LKYGFYPLANASDELLQQYSLVGPLMERKDDLLFRDRLLRGLKEFFSTLYRRVTEVCRWKRISVSSIGLSIPAQWKVDFEDIYRDIIAEVFCHPRSAIYIHTETVALAHYLFRNHMDEGELHGVKDVVLFLDFGGHNMVSYQFL
jgi:hypothetical protein